MTRVHVEGEVYELVSSPSLYEETLERVLVQRQAEIFPFAYCVRFKRRISSAVGNAEADLVLVDRQLRRWWIVEVELAHHDLHGHVMRQVAVFAEARYGAADADYLLRESEALRPHEARLISLVKGAAPGLLVIADRWNEDWARAIRQYDARLAVVELYRSRLNRLLLRTSGDFPTLDETVVTYCEQYNAIGRALKLTSPENMEPHRDDTGVVTIRTADGLTEWRWLSLGDLTLLTPSGRCPLDERYRHFQIAYDGKTLNLKPIR